jgi:hypothetical protein
LERILRLVAGGRGRRHRRLPKILRPTQERTRRLRASNIGASPIT